MSKNFFQLFSEFNPLRANQTEEAHKHSYLKVGGVEGYRCVCDEVISMDAVLEYGVQVVEVKSEKDEILDMIDEMLLDPPMRGDVALVWLRNKIEKRN
jgi:hypothetical protein